MSPFLRWSDVCADRGTGGQALILRHYTANWAAPDDRKINPWDLNEPDPSTTGGTIPGPTLECTVREQITVHFRNKYQLAEDQVEQARRHDHDRDGERTPITAVQDLRPPSGTPQGSGPGASR